MLIPAVSPVQTQYPIKTNAVPPLCQGPQLLASRRRKAEVLSEAGRPPCPAPLCVTDHSMMKHPAVTNSRPHLGHKSELGGDSSALLWQRPVAQPAARNGLMETDAGQLLVLHPAGCGASLASFWDRSPSENRHSLDRARGSRGALSRHLTSGLQHQQPQPMSWLEPTQRPLQAGVITAPHTELLAPAPTQWLQPRLQDLVMLTALRPQSPFQVLM